MLPSPCLLAYLPRMKTLLITGIAALASSIFSTFIVDHYLLSRISILGSFVGFERIMNDGIAFGVDLPLWLMVTLIPIVIFIICILAYRSKKDSLSSIAFGLILGGALGNIIDRLNDSHVTDFIQIGWWPIFNIADSCITIGVAILFLMECRAKSMAKKAK